MADDKIPVWVPELSPGVHADVYPVSPPQTPAPTPTPAELRLDRHSVTHGYAERRLPYEFSSVLPSERTTPSLTSAPAGEAPQQSTLTQSDLHKLRAGLQTLRRSRPTKLQRVELPAPENKGKPFPLQKPSASSSLEDWFNRLSSSTPLSDLSRSVPLGPAIVRAAGKVIEMLATRGVPTQRAAWYIRVAVLNECVKQARPDRPSPSPRAFWTRQLCTLLKADVEAIRARKTAVLGSMDRVAFWRYVLDLARWQADEGLLDVQPWLGRIAAILRTELLASQTFAAPATRISLLAARRFLPEFLASVESATLLCDALIPGANAVVKAWRAAVTKPAKGKKPGKRFQPNACHAEITLLLAAALRAIQADIVLNSEMRLSDLEKLVKRGVEVVHAADKRRKLDVPEIRRSPHLVLRELERLPAHGDVASVVTAVKYGCDHRQAVKKVGMWAVEGPAWSRAEALCVGASVISALSDSVRTSQAPKKRVRKGIHQPKGVTIATPPLQREVWTFVKEFSQGRELQSLDTDDNIVRFIATLCRLDQLSLPVFVRDVSRLVSSGHPGAPYLVKCLSLLPDPVDKSIADCRRALLRKFGYMSAHKVRESRGVEEKALEAACSGNIIAARKEAKELLERGKTNTTLSTTEAVRLEDVILLKSDDTPVLSRLHTKASFMLQVGEPGMAVDWMLETLGDVLDGTGPWGDEKSGAKRLEVLSAIIRISEYLARSVAACGHLEYQFLLFRKAWTCKWVSRNIRAQIIHTQTTYCRLFGANSGSGRMFWTKMVAKNMRQASDGATAASLCPLAIASMQGVEDSNSRQQGLADILNINTQENLGISVDADLEYMKSRSERCGVKMSKLRQEFVRTTTDFPFDQYFLKGLSANDMLGSVLIPLLGENLKDLHEEKSLEGTFAMVAAVALNLFREREHDALMHSVRPALLVEFISILIVGCMRGRTTAEETLEVLVDIRWIWNILAPGAGIALAKRLQSRVSHYCQSTSQDDKRHLSGALFNMLTRYSGKESRDEAAVSNALESEPFGIVETQLALLAAHRKEAGDEHEFGTKISDAANSLITEDTARALVSTSLQSCLNEEFRLEVAGIIAFGAVQAMGESLQYVVTGLTVEPSKSNDLHQERAQQWCEVDSARRAVLESATESLSQEVGAQVEPVLFEQLVAAAEQLKKAEESRSMLSVILEDGKRVSDALESRLNLILRIPRTSQPSDVWRQRTLQVVAMLKNAVPLMKSSAIHAVSNVMNLCIRSLGEAGKPEDSASPIPLNQILDRPTNVELKSDLESQLTPILLWMEAPEKELFAKIVPRCTQNGRKRTIPVKAYKADGSEVDNWVLLEGYGRGGDEEPALPPVAFWRQAEGASHGENVTPAVHLKRTYSTFASLAV